MTSPWSEAQIANALVRQVFKRQLLIVPRCNWTGNECDLLAVEPGLRLIDIEIKISRADLRADRSKDKWWKVEQNIVQAAGGWRSERVIRDWPRQIWKHYYVLPAKIWKPELAQDLPSLNSGVVLLEEGNYGNLVTDVWRRAVPNRQAKPIEAADVLDIARLAGLRMWDALEQRK